MTLGQFKQALHASGIPHSPPAFSIGKCNSFTRSQSPADALTYLDILSPSWKLFVAQHDAQTSKVDIGRLLTVSSCLLSSAFSRVKSR